MIYKVVHDRCKYFVTYRSKYNSIQGSFKALGNDYEEAKEVAVLSIKMKYPSENIEEFEIIIQEITGGFLEEIILDISSLFRF